MCTCLTRALEGALTLQRSQRSVRRLIQPPPVFSNHPSRSVRAGSNRSGRGAAQLQRHLARLCGDALDVHCKHPPRRSGCAWRRSSDARVTCLLCRAPRRRCCHCCWRPLRLPAPPAHALHRSMTLCLAPSGLLAPSRGRAASTRPRPCAARRSTRRTSRQAAPTAATRARGAATAIAA